MSRRMIFPALLGLVGCAILLWLGMWQVQRLAWKEGILAEISAKIAADPVALPADPMPDAHKYMPVTVTGRYLQAELHVLFSLKFQGPGYRVIAPFETEDGRKILVDRGFIPTPQKDAARQTGAATITGNLHWPDEIDGYTPDPDQAANIWFARDLTAMAEILGTEPVLVVVRSQTPVDAAVRPVPITITGIPNDHLQYAVTWFLLAIAWAGMTVYLLWRIRQRSV